MEQKILLEILNELKAQNAATGELWTVDDVARYLRLSKSSVQSRVIGKSGFPRAVRIPTEAGMGGGRRWYRKEVVAWVSRNREPLQ